MATAEIEVQRLKRQLRDAEEASQKAAKYGLELLDSQADLQSQMEDQRKEMTNDIEVRQAAEVRQPLLLGKH